MTAPARRQAAGAGKGEFVAVGVGIGGVGQVTLEAAEVIKRADKLFYCVVNPAVELWLRDVNPTAESLTPLYQEGRDRADTYADMAQAFKASVRRGGVTCAAFYGHPGVLVEATHAAIRSLRREGYRAQMLPGVSADACLYSDLLVNPGDDGVQMHEASRFLYQDRDWDPRSGLVLYQVGVIGRTAWTARPKRDQQRVDELYDALRQHYSDDHPVVLYYASTFPCDPPSIRRFRLRDLPSRRINPMDMLYVPPVNGAR